MEVQGKNGNDVYGRIHEGGGLRAARGKRSLLQRVTTVLVTVAMLAQMLPSQALAQMVTEAEASQLELLTDASEDVTEQIVDLTDQADEGEDEAIAVVDPTPPEQDPAAAEENPAKPEGNSDGDAVNLSAQLAEGDVFYFKDVETGQIVTTLHTSRSYLLVEEDGETPCRQLNDDVIWFRPVGSWRDGTKDKSNVNLSGVYDWDVYHVRVRALELFYAHNSSVYNMRGPWAMPTGLYDVGTDKTTLTQRYQVVNDGLSRSFFDPSDLYDPDEDEEWRVYDEQRYHDSKTSSFSVKPYTEGATDETYDGVYDEEDQTYVNTVDSLNEIPLTSDVRLSVVTSSAVTLADGVQPQLESIGLWEYDGTLEDIRLGQYVESGIYGIRDLFDESVLSRVDGMGESVPAWPNVFNFTDESKVTTLWQRGEDEELAYHYVPPAEIGTYWYTDFGRLVIEHVNFSAAASKAKTGKLYFPVVKVVIAGETYTYTYYPYEVTRDADYGRANPTITTQTLADARVGDAYSATLEGRSGITGESELTWAVTDGALPDGLALDAATGIITGTPTKAGEFTFAVTLTETVGGEGLSVTREFALNVREAASSEDVLSKLSLGAIAYEPQTVWPSANGRRDAYVPIRIPVSLDLTDKRYDLCETELWYMLQVTEEHHYIKPKEEIVQEDRYCVCHVRASDVMNEDGTELVVSLPVEGTELNLYRVKKIKRICAFLVPRYNNGDYYPNIAGIASSSLVYGDQTPEQTLARIIGSNIKGRWIDGLQVDFADGPRLYWHGSQVSLEDLPQIAYTVVEDPAIVYGSRIRFPSLRFGGGLYDEDDPWPVTEGRVRIWPYDGTTTPTDQQVGTISYNQYNSAYVCVDEDDDNPNWREMWERSHSATFELPAGTYAFVAEGAVPVYDEEGQMTDDVAWVDISGNVPGARAIKGTYPTQYVIEVSGYEGYDWVDGVRETVPRVISMTYSESNYEFYQIKPLFEQEDGTYGEQDATFDVSWYRRRNAGTSDQLDVLVATGNSVSLEASEDPLYVEVTPTKSTASFWKRSQLQKVDTQNHVTEVKLGRKPLFSGTFELSCASGKVPADGESWGVIEVQMPLSSGGYDSSDIWVKESPVAVSNLTSGCILTFTPNPELEASSVSYTVPDATEADFEASLVAPLQTGTIDFEGLDFTDVEEQTSAFWLTDGNTEVTVKRLEPGGTREYSVPFYLAGASRLVLQPEIYYKDYYLNHEEDTTYRITVTHRDSTAPDRMGGSAADYAARQSFDVTLSPSKTSAVVPPATFTSRGYALVTLRNPANKACDLVLYQKTGNGNTGDDWTLCDHSGAGKATQLRTPFLAAGSYKLYAVDSNLMPLSSDAYPTERWLIENASLKGNNASHATSVSFEVADGAVTKLDGDAALTFPAWEGANLIDRATSSVLVENVYTDKVAITMHAELTAGVSLSQNAHLELSTNQKSGEFMSGYMNPKALSLNGKSVQLSRWSNLFNDTQKMGDGTLTILLAEAAKTNASCASFPLDMTLVIPRTVSGYTEANVWLVDGETRSLVGTYLKAEQETTITVPSMTAWKTFGVYGDTGPNAEVTIYVDGMRAATTVADEYGYYEADLSLPTDARDLDSFNVNASATWKRGTSENAETLSATSETASVTYTTSCPVVERITMCYQPDVDEPYQSVVSYERGKQPNKYVSLYRAEHDNENTEEGADHAKYFWLVEFANGDEVDAGSVVVRVPRSTESIDIQTTDELATAESWIGDVKAAQVPADASQYPAGSVVSKAFATDVTRAFVCEPTYFTYAPDEVEVEFDYVEHEESEIKSMEHASSMQYRGFEEEALTEEALEAYTSKLYDKGLLLPYSGDASRLTKVPELGSQDAASYAAWAKNDATKYDTAFGAFVDREWLLVGDDSDDPDYVPTSYLKVRRSFVKSKKFVLDTLGYWVDHSSSGGYDPTTGQYHSGSLDIPPDPIWKDAQRVVKAYEHWLETGKAPANAALGYYDGGAVVAASGPTQAQHDGLMYAIETQQGDGVLANRRFEMMMRYCTTDDFWTSLRFDSSSTDYVYVQLKVDRQSYTLNVWDLTTHDQTSLIYELDASQVNDNIDMYVSDVLEQWCAINYVIEHAIDSAIEAEGADQAIAGQSTEDATTFSAQGENPKPVKGYAQKAKHWYDFFTDPNVTNQEVRGALDQIKQDDVTNLANPQYPGSVPTHAYGSQKNRVKAAGTCIAGMVATTGQTMKNAKDLADSPVNTSAKWFSNYSWPAIKDWWQNRKAEQDYQDWAKEKVKQMTGKPNNLDYWKKNKPDKMKEYSKRFQEEQKKKKTKNPKVTHDPSGFVYEAVLSNPVEGATVKLYTYNKAGNTATFLDSTKFGVEENPQLTGANGRYQWFVPEGFWQVRVTKSGYEPFSTGDAGHEETRYVYAYDADGKLVRDGDDNPVVQETKTVMVGDYGIDATRDLDGDGTDDVDSYWMPVLPVQLDVNIGLVSKAAPKVTSIKAQSDGVLVTFSKYVDVKTVKAELFQVGLYGDESEDTLATSPSVAAQNAEDAADGSTASDGSLPKQLATKFLVAYNDATKAAIEATEGEQRVTLRVADPQGTITSYAGTGLHEESRRFVGTVKLDRGFAKTQIDGATITVADQTYSGQPLTPVPEVVVGGKTLLAGVDYTVAYENNVELGMATVIVTGTGSYEGTARATFRIAPFFVDVFDATAPKPTAHHEDITWLAGAGITQGWKLKDGTFEFRPYANVARADMAAFLFRLARSWGIVDDAWQPDGSAKFDDVTQKTAHYREIMWLAQSGISKGWSMKDGTVEFRPLANVARADMAAFIARLWRLAGYSTNGSKDFLDVKENTAHKEDIRWLAAAGISTGWPNADGTAAFRPLANVARADIAAFLYRLDTKR